MTPDQFKAWFEGFCEAIDATPTPEQWAKIKAKVADIREKPLVTLREPEFKRQWSTALPQNEPLIARGVALVKEAGLEPEFGGTRIAIDARPRRPD